MPEVGRSTGGHLARAAIRQALRAGGVKSLKVGFFKSAKYPDGTYVAAVAAWTEFGTRSGRYGPVPERPFFRQAIKRSIEPVTELVREEVDPREMTLNEKLGDMVGALVKGQVQRRIVELRDPPNAPATIARKGSSNPLIDVGKMRQAVTWRTTRRQ